MKRGKPSSSTPESYSTNGRNLILPMIEGNVGRKVVPGANEDEAFKQDVASRPDAASLKDYEAVPVEEFGAALLRGMGWKEGEAVGRRKDLKSEARDVKRRPALLGLGAKKLNDAEELGAWVHKSWTQKGNEKKRPSDYRRRSPDRRDSSRQRDSDYRRRSPDRRDSPRRQDSDYRSSRR
jgi:hypothetical protein